MSTKAKPRTRTLVRTLLLAAAMLALFFAPALAAERAIPSILVDVVLYGDGSATVTEIWEIRGVYSGTEYYKALYNMEGRSVHSLSVWDEFGAFYETLASWDTNRSLEEKAGTCGILRTADGYELCWGIGSYGDHTYTIQYTVENLVMDYGDYAGFYHQFVSELTSAPEYVSVAVCAADAPLTEDNARIWGYGYTGEVQIGGDGVLYAFSTEALGRKDYVNVLCRFDRSLFPLAQAAGETFEGLQRTAKGGMNPAALIVLLAGLAVVIGAAIVAGVFYSSRFKLSDGATVKLPGKRYIREEWRIPFGGSIPAAYAALRMLRRGVTCAALMSAYLVRWQEAGLIDIRERAIRRGRGEKKEEVIVFAPGNAPEEGLERMLFDILAECADHEGVLWFSDVQKSAEALHEALARWAREVDAAGEQALAQSGAAAANAKGALRFTAAGFEEGVRLLGLHKYLSSLRGPGDETCPREFWGDYFAFAVLFDIGESVLRAMQTIDPDYYGAFAGRYHCDTYSMLYFVTMTNHFADVSNPRGADGSASPMGGGGASGGGGGGSR